MDEHTRRVAANETVFRALNEKLEALNEAFVGSAETFVIVCECGDLSCAEQIDLTPGEYRRVRVEPTHFVIVPGHEVVSTEHVIARHKTYEVVRKDAGLPARLAEESAP